jgi:hypothetical protein
MSQQRSNKRAGHFAPVAPMRRIGRYVFHREPPQRGALLNYLIYPYAELDGAPIAQDKIKSSFAYHDVSPGK